MNKLKFFLILIVTLLISTSFASELYIEDQQVDENTDFDIPVLIKLDGKNIGAFNFDLKYDSSKLTYKEITLDSTNLLGFVVVGNSDITGGKRIAVMNFVGGTVASDGEILKVAFTSTSDDSDVTLDGIILSTSTGQTVQDYTSNSATITIGSGSCVEGNACTIVDDTGMTPVNTAGTCCSGACVAGTICPDDPPPCSPDCSADPCASDDGCGNECNACLIVGQGCNYDDICANYNIKITNMDIVYTPEGSSRQTLTTLTENQDVVIDIDYSNYDAPELRQFNMLLVKYESLWLDLSGKSVGSGEIIINRDNAYAEEDWDGFVRTTWNTGVDITEDSTNIILCAYASLDSNYDPANIWSAISGTTNYLSHFCKEYELVDGDDDDDGQNAPLDCNDNDPDIYSDAVDICDKKDNNCNGLIDENNICDDVDGDGDGYYSIVDVKQYVGSKASEILLGNKQYATENFDLPIPLNNIGDAKVVVYAKGSDSSYCAGSKFLFRLNQNELSRISSLDDFDQSYSWKTFDLDETYLQQKNILDLLYYCNLDGLDCPGPQSCSSGCFNAISSDCDLDIALDSNNNPLMYLQITPKEPDCDDTDPKVYLGAPEICDGKDNDCDGVIPENEIDHDGDGFSECQGDVDDTDPLVTGVIEVCNDNIDNDWDGHIDCFDSDCFDICEIDRTVICTSTDKIELAADSVSVSDNANLEEIFDTITGWLEQMEFSSDDPVYLDVDLGELKTISKVVFKFDNSRIPVEYIIAISEDNINWKIVANARNTNSDKSTGEFTPTKTRYIRLYVTEANYVAGSKWTIAPDDAIGGNSEDDYFYKAIDVYYCGCSEDADCSADLVCNSNGECEPGEEIEELSCTSTCASLGDALCEGNTHKTCMMDELGCLQWTDSYNCDFGEYCSEGICQPVRETDGFDVIFAASDVEFTFKQFNTAGTSHPVFEYNKIPYPRGEDADYENAGNYKYFVNSEVIRKYGIDYVDFTVDDLKTSWSSDIGYCSLSDGGVWFSVCYGDEDSDCDESSRQDLDKNSAITYTMDVDSSKEVYNFKMRYEINCGRKSGSQISSFDAKYYAAPTDLIVKGINLDPISPTERGNLIITSTIENIGYSPTDAFKVSIYKSNTGLPKLILGSGSQDEFIGEGTISGLNPTGSDFIEVTWSNIGVDGNDVAEREFDICAYADSENVIAELNDVDSTSLVKIIIGGGDTQDNIACQTVIVQDGDDDGDGYVNPTDCDDSKIEINPGAIDICDNIDNNCDTQIDEDFIDLGTECSVGVGACENTGVFVCSVDGATTECSVSEGTSLSEFCDNGVDDDCDGDLDCADDECISYPACIAAFCGDGTCDADEDCDSCSDDCGACPECTDSDGGNDPNVAGTIDGRDATEGVSYSIKSDYCDEDINVVSMVDEVLSCSGSTCGVREYFCLTSTEHPEGFIGAESILCPNGCENGACLSGCITDVDCDDGLYCNGVETCNAGTCESGTPVDCSSNSIAAISACDNDPDNNVLTLDTYSGFTSTCDETTDSCTTETLTINNVCSVSCGAVCAVDADCAATSCTDQNSCGDEDADGFEDDYYIYSNVDNACLSDCACETNVCGDPTVSVDDPVCAECATDDECNSLDDRYCDGINYITKQGKCDTLNCVAEITTTENCDDEDVCTVDACTSLGCIGTPASCGVSDGCCPSGCTSILDDDCSVDCGNGACETGEDCKNCVSDCGTCECIDTDAKDYFTPTTSEEIVSESEKYSYYDRCVVVEDDSGRLYAEEDGVGYTDYDECSGEDCYVAEAYCNGDDEVVYDVYQCPNGCVAAWGNGPGACNEEDKVLLDLETNDTTNDTVNETDDEQDDSSSGSRGGTRFIAIQTTYNAACNDSIDNDADGKIDYPADPGCASAADENEVNQAPSTPTTVRTPVTTIPITTIRDQPTISSAVCGNDNCEATETSDTCPDDCKKSNLIWIVVISIVLVGIGILAFKHYISNNSLGGTDIDFINMPPGQPPIQSIQQPVQQIQPQQPRQPTMRQRIVKRAIRTTVRPRLSNYIQSSRSNGFSDIQIRQALLAKGWKQNSVDRALSSL
jgi:hypothetical protein